MHRNILQHNDLYLVSCGTTWHALILGGWSDFKGRWVAPLLRKQGEYLGLCRDPFHRRGYHFRFGDTPRVICLINAWVQLTTVLNELARSMGQHDLYPFVMWRPVLRKMQFIQMVVKEAREGQKVVG